jgi:hypothetical protein
LVETERRDYWVTAAREESRLDFESPWEEHPSSLDAETMRSQSVEEVAFEVLGTQWVEFVGLEIARVGLAGAVLESQSVERGAVAVVEMELLFGEDTDTLEGPGPIAGSS